MTRTNRNTPARIPAVLCLAAGSSQMVVIEKAQQLGYAVIAVDRNPEAPGFSCCDVKIEASTYEAEPIISQLRPLLTTYRLVGVINRSSGLPVITAAEICYALNLPAPTPAAARTLTDKSQLMQACRRAGIATPWCQTVTAFVQVDHSQVEYPCVVKPAISLVGKSGITVVRLAHNLAAALATAQAVSLNKRVNIEEFLPGRDVSLVALVNQGTIHKIVLKDELTSILPAGGVRFSGVAVPSIFSGEDEETLILELASQVVQEFQLENTVLNLSCRCAPGGQPKLIEIHLDLGGDSFFEGLAPESTSTDLLGLLITFLAGQREEFPHLEFKPTALVFDQTAEQKPGRPYTILQAATRLDLESRLDRWLNS